MTTGDGPKTSLEIERFLLGELAPEQAERLRSRLGDEALRALVEQHTRDGAALFAALPPERFGREVEARAARASAADRKRPALRRFAPAVAIAAALLTWIAVEGTPRERAFETRDETRPKGLAPALLLFRKGTSSVEELRPGARVAERDLLQLGYVAAGRSYGAVLSLDGSGAVTLHEPGPRLTPAGKHMLSRAYVLDDAPRFERFVLVTSARPFDIQTVLAAAERLASRTDADLAPLELSPGIEQTSFVVRKTKP